MAQKKVKSFRISPSISALVRKAADAEGVSEAEIIERCIIAQADRIANDAVFRELIFSDARVREALASKLTKPGGK